MPPMKVADLADDAEVLTEVEKLAEDILARDPMLASAENAGLRKNVEDLFRAGQL